MLRKDQSNSTGDFWEPWYLYRPWHGPEPCPTCGYCPTCGRKRSRDWTYPNYTIWCADNDCGTSAAGENVSSSDYHTDCVCQA